MVIPGKVIANEHVSDPYHLHIYVFVVEKEIQSKKYGYSLKNVKGNAKF